jgi:hypothetical protein
MRRLSYSALPPTKETDGLTSGMGRLLSETERGAFAQSTRREHEIRSIP